MTDEEALAAIRGNEMRWWLCEGRGDFSHATLVLGWSAMVKLFASQCVNWEAPPEAIREAEEWLTRNVDDWNFTDLTAKWHTDFEDGGWAVTLVTDTTSPANSARDAVRSVVRSAWALVDDSEDLGDEGIRVDRRNYAALSADLDILTALIPQGEQPASAGHAVTLLWPAATVDTDADLLRAIDERDDAQEAISEAYSLVTGRSPEWSNLFGYKDALEEIAGVVSWMNEA